MWWFNFAIIFKCLTFIQNCSVMENPWPLARLFYSSPTFIIKHFCLISSLNLAIFSLSYPVFVCGVKELFIIRSLTSLMLISFVFRSTPGMIMVWLLDPGTIHTLTGSHLQPGQEAWTSFWSITVLSNQCDMASAGSLPVSSTHVGIGEKSYTLLYDSCITERAFRLN